jgi:hypothetical protein
MNGNFPQIPRSSRIRPVRRRANGKTWTWKDTVLQCPCGYLDGEEGPQLFPFTPPEHLVELVIFSNDYPVFIRPFSTYPTPANAPIPAVPSFPEDCPMQDGLHFSGYNAIYTTTQPIPVGLQGAVYGTTITHGVNFSGFGCAMTIYDRGYLDDFGQPLKCGLEMDVIATGAVLEGEAYYGETEGPAYVLRGAFLLESDYTQAIADNDNVYTFTAPGYHLDVVVMGIFAEVATGKTKTPSRQRGLFR